MLLDYIKVGFGILCGLSVAALFFGILIYLALFLVNNIRKTIFDSIQAIHDNNFQYLIHDILKESLSTIFIILMCLGYTAITGFILAYGLWFIEYCANNGSLPFI